MKLSGAREQRLETCIPVRFKMAINPRSSSFLQAPSILSEKSSSKIGYFVMPIILFNPSHIYNKTLHQSEYDLTTIVIADSRFYTDISADSTLELKGIDRK